MNEMSLSQTLDFLEQVEMADDGDVPEADFQLKLEGDRVEGRPMDAFMLQFSRNPETT